MARKRNGLAGIWDRNKHIIKPVAAGAGFMFGGPGGAAAVNGAISGFDRKGKGGIGFDVGAGVKGAATGYLGGRLAQGLTGVQGGNGMSSLRDMFSKNTANHLRDRVGSGLWEGASAAGRVGNWATKDPKNLLALGQTAIGGLNAYGTAQQNALLNQRANQSRQDSEQQRRMRELLLPYFTDYLGNLGGR
jgi:hypothetical protein